MDGYCVIIGAGEVYSPEKSEKRALVIAADGGYEKAVICGISPDMIIGDFDSGSEPINTEAFVVKLKRDKDDTDMLAAVKAGLRRGYRDFVIYGGVGGRADHTVANFAVLRYLNNFDARGFLIFENSVATVITDGKLKLKKGARGTASVFAYGGDAEGVTLEGFKFPLNNAALTPDFPLGTSNEIISDAEISVKHGSLLVFFPRP